MAKDSLEKYNLKILIESRKRGSLTPDESQIILEDSKNDLVGIGAKIRMIQNQVLRNNYWGKQIEFLQLQMSMASSITDLMSVMAL